MALIHIGFFSEALGMCASCDVILPQKSNALIGMESATRGAKHPVLWLLHGASDNHTIWQRRTSIERYVAPLGLAVVMPNAHLSSYEDMAHGGQYQTYITEELPEIMRGFFPFSAERADNYIAGLSMGGAGSLRMGLKNPDKYAAIGCFSAGIVNKTTSMQTNPIWKARMEITYGDRDPGEIGEAIKCTARENAAAGKPLPRVYHACGTEDFVLANARDTRDFFTSLPGNPYEYVYDECPGAHTWEFWDDHIQDFLAYINIAPVKEA